MWFLSQEIKLLSLHPVFCCFQINSFKSQLSTESDSALLSRMSRSHRMRLTADTPLHPPSLSVYNVPNQTSHCKLFTLDSTTEFHGFCFSQLCGHIYLWHDFYLSLTQWLDLFLKALMLTLHQTYSYFYLSIFYSASRSLPCHFNNKSDFIFVHATNMSQASRGVYWQDYGDTIRIMILGQRQDLYVYKLYIYSVMFFLKDRVLILQRTQ